MLFTTLGINNNYKNNNTINSKSTDRNCITTTMDSSGHIKVEETDIPDEETGFPGSMRGHVIRGKFIPINKKTWINIDIDGNDSILDCASQVVPLMIKKPNIFPPKLAKPEDVKGSTVKEDEDDEEEEKEDVKEDEIEDSEKINKEDKKEENDEVVIESDSEDKNESQSVSTTATSSTTTTTTTTTTNNTTTNTNTSTTTTTTVGSNQLSKTGQQSSESGQDNKTPTESNNLTMLTISDYYKSSAGNLLMGIGLSRSKEWYHKDVIRQLHRSIRKQGEVDDLVEELKRQQQLYNECKAANSIFTFPLKRCHMCDFKTESEVAMDGHLSIPHLSNRKEYRCNFCVFSTRDTQIIVSHFKDTHNRQCILESPPLINSCPICPYESSQKAKAATHIAKCMKFFNPDKVQYLPDPESEYPAITPKPITQDDIKVYDATLIALRAAALSSNNQLPNLPGLPRGLQHQMLMMQQQQVALQSKAMQRANKIIPGLKSNPSALRNAANFDITSNPNFAKSNAPQLYHMLQAGGHTQLVPVQQSKYPPGVNSTTHLQAVKGRVIPGAGALLQKSPAGMRPNATDTIDSPAGKGGTFVICEICDGYIKDLEQLRTHMQWIHKVKIHPKMLASRPPLNCQKCQWRFFTDQGLERHLLGAHGLVTSNMQDMVDQNQDGGRCTICGRISANKLVAHMNQVHKITLRPALLSYKCTVCSATFNLYRLFENHVYMVHSGSVKRNLDDSNQSLVKKQKTGLNGSECHMKN
ncbi:MOG interacting and ectopic P-granules protein 1-like [Panonychus citri]|uniref:MOG interacting and ectopic P-granules protein 1-like n=1 Tax=Panonychus citri TaxID=50023 RepID=UPI0023082D9C|nr:MOG interacting and ectopic P-granules protein 1-like [Panonychus citri]